MLKIHFNIEGSCKVPHFFVFCYPKNPKKARRVQIPCAHGGLFFFVIGSDRIIYSWLPLMLL